MTLTREQIETLLKLAYAATPGPWRTMDGIHSLWIDAPENREHIAAVFRIKNGKDNAAFIAAANPAVLKALCDMALNWLALQPRPMSELPKNDWVAGWFVGEGIPAYRLISQSLVGENLVWGGGSHRPKEQYTHFIPLSSLPEPKA